METTMTIEEQKFRATLQAEDVFTRAGVTLPDEPDERRAYFDLVEAAATMASEQLVGKVQAATEAANRAATECDKLRAAVKRALEKAQTTVGRANAAATKRIAAIEAERAKLVAQLATQQADEAEAADQSAELSSEEISLLVGQSTTQPDD